MLGCTRDCSGSLITLPWEVSITCLPFLPSYQLCLLQELCTLEGLWGEWPPLWSLTGHCHLAKATSSVLFVTRVTQLGAPCAVTAGLHLFSSREEFHSNSTSLSIPEALSWLQAIKVSMQMRGLISTQLGGSCKGEALSPISLKGWEGRGRGRGNELATAPNGACSLLIQPDLEAELKSCLLRRFVIAMKAHSGVTLSSRAEGKTIFYP